VGHDKGLPVNKFKQAGQSAEAAWLTSVGVFEIAVTSKPWGYGICGVPSKTWQTRQKNPPMHICSSGDPF